ncbi:MAG: hypothetical protein Q4B71_05935 [Cardiobacteriaceae bacterium]|nr:hypothetical protein [Cardiobacteriaceae bacterium]
MDKFFIALLMGFFLWRLYQAHKSGGIKALFEKSRQAEQHWQTFALLMGGVLLFVILLIQL